MQIRKIFFSLILSMMAILPSYAGDNWTNVSAEEMWLQDPDFYNPRYETDRLLPNGFRLLFEMNGGLIQRGRSQGTLSEGEQNLVDLNLVRIQSPDGQIFQGLGEEQLDHNYLPVYGVIAGKGTVYYDYDINFNKLPLPEKLTGKWYAPFIDMIIGDPDEKWKETHGGAKNPYSHDRLFHSGHQYDDPMITYLLTEYPEVTFGSNPEYSVYMYWTYQVPHEPLSSATIKKRGGKKYGKVYETGGYIADMVAEKWYQMTYDWNPQTGFLKLKFGPREKTKWELDWHSWSSVPGSGVDPGADKKDAPTDHDFKNVNPRTAYLRKALAEWCVKSADYVWGEIDLRVYAVTDRYMVIEGVNYVNSRKFLELWIADSVRGGKLNTERRKDIIETLMALRGGVRASKAATAKRLGRQALLKEHQAAEYKALENKWMGCLAEVLQAYQQGWEAYKKERSSYGERNPKLRYGKGWLVSDAEQRLAAKTDPEFKQVINQKFASIKDAVCNDEKILAEIVGSSDFAPYQVTEGSISFLLRTPDGIKQLNIPITYRSRYITDDNIRSEFAVNGDLTISNAPASLPANGIAWLSSGAKKRPKGD